MRLLLVLSLFCLKLNAVYSVGDKIPNRCWSELGGKKWCLSDGRGSVVVLLHSAGWCGPCNAEFRDAVNETAGYAGKSVIFVSLSLQGWSSGSNPDDKFLKEWSGYLRGAKASWVVAASPRDGGRDYFISPSIPNVAVIDASGALSYKAIAPGWAAIRMQINKAMK